MTAAYRSAAFLRAEDVTSIALFSMVDAAPGQRPEGFESLPYGHHRTTVDGSCLKGLELEEGVVDLRTVVGTLLGEHKVERSGVGSGLVEGHGPQVGRDPAVEGLHHTEDVPVLEFGSGRVHRLSICDLRVQSQEIAREPEP